MEPVSWGAWVARVLLGLVAIGALAVVFIRLLGGRAGRGGRAMRVLDRLALERGRTLWLVEVPGKVLVVATGPDRTEALAELEPDEVARLTEEQPEAGDTPWWARLLAGRGDKERP